MLRMLASFRGQTDYQRVAQFRDNEDEILHGHGEMKHSDYTMLIRTLPLVCLG